MVAEILVLVGGDPASSRGGFLVCDAGVRRVRLLFEELVVFQHALEVVKQDVTPLITPPQARGPP